MWTCSSCRRRSRLHAASALAHVVSACSQLCCTATTWECLATACRHLCCSVVHHLQHGFDLFLCLRAEEAANGALDLHGTGTKTTNPFVLDLEEEEAMHSGCGARMLAGSWRMFAAAVYCSLEACTPAMAAHPYLGAPCTQGGGPWRRRQAGCISRQGGRRRRCRGRGCRGHGAADDGRAVPRPEAALRLPVRRYRTLARFVPPADACLARRLHTGAPRCSHCLFR